MKPDGVAPTGKAYRIALCDDKKFDVSDWKLFLGSRGFYVQSFENALELVAAVRKLPGDFDLIVLDLVMPVLDGYAAFFEMKASGRMPKVMFVSVENTPTVVRSLIEAGAADYLARPFTKDVLLERIKKVLARPST